jgi:2-keto-4-pentenoate hydratase
MPYEMDMSRINEAAGLLANARRTGVLLDELPECCEVRNFWEAYAIQDAVMREIGEPIGGWKADARSDHARTNFAPILSRTIKPSPASFPAATICGVEVEWIFCLTTDFRPREKLYERAEVAECVTLHPGIEVMESRFTDISRIKRLSTVADNNCNGGLVYGPALPPGWHDLHFARPHVTVRRNGRLWMLSNGLHFTDPLRNVTELINHLCVRRGGVSAETFVTTGTCTGITFAEPGDEIVVDWGGHGVLNLNFPV